MSEQQEYRVLARKYRSQNFDDLIGQEPLVRTLKNAIEAGRIAHAFMLTGIRGVGKTSTARIIAKALNYRGADGQAGPTTGSTDDCDVCQAIAAGRHPDVIEMDAASHTGVDDIREIIDGARYAPSSARYKIYIIDEVHMLSKNAFNALLKTLEEPPAHVKFIFATTEIRKVPITVLSRCQRFDLRRIELEDLKKHYQVICQKEGAEFDDQAITMIARAADGSVRDGLSILDQAIALGNGKVRGDIVSDMLGLSDVSETLDLFEAIMGGQPEIALTAVSELYTKGGDPAQIVEDLCHFTHILTKTRVLKEGADLSEYSAEMQERLKTLAYKVSMPGLNRAWQILMKGLTEVKMAAHPLKAAEMVIIRLIYASEMPDPLDLLKKIQSGEISAGDTGQASVETASAGDDQRTLMSVRSGGGKAVAAQPRISPEAENHVENITAFKDMDELYEFLSPREVVLANELYEYAHPVKFDKGVVHIRLKDGARPDIYARLSKSLKDYTGNPFMVNLSQDQGLPTLSERRVEKRAQDLHAARENEGVKKILESFPDAELVEILYDDE